MKVLRQVGLYVLLAIVFWAGAFGIAYGVVEWRGEGEPIEQSATSSSQQRLLTGGEAAAKAQSYFYDQVVELGEAGKVAVSCDPEDFNSRTNAWIIKCVFRRSGSPAGSTRATVNDRTGETNELP